MKKTKTKPVRASRIPKKPEIKYRKQLLAIVVKVRASARKIIFPVLKDYEHEYVADTYVNEVEKAFIELRKSYAELTKTSKAIAKEFVTGVDKDNRQKFFSAINESMGVNLQKIVKKEGLEGVISASVKNNTIAVDDLVKEYTNKLEKLVYSGTIKGTPAGGLIQQIMELGEGSVKKAKFIARTQTASINAAITKARQQNLGIVEYVWLTAKDGDRVRQTHRNNHNKTFRWDKPPATGHPGEDYNCRCVAKPVINLEAL